METTVRAVRKKNMAMGTAGPGTKNDSAGKASSISPETEKKKKLVVSQELALVLGG
jgi:hypothetical protein